MLDSRFIKKPFHRRLSKIYSALMICDLWFSKGPLIEKKLEDLKVTDVKINSEKGKNPSYVLRLLDGSRAVFKPSALFNSPESEVAAYKLDRLLAFRLVPLTVMRKVRTSLFSPPRKGSLQIFVEGAHSAESEEAAALMKSESATRLVVFDIISANNDHRTGNFLVKGRDFVAIDNGESFAENFKYKLDFLKELPRLGLYDIEHLSSLKREDFERELSPWIGDKRALESFDRLQAIIKFYKEGRP